MSDKKIFIIWKVYQRRAESLAENLDLDIRYVHYSWEEKSKVHKLFSYILKSISTILILVREKPNFLFIQLPPTPLLYIVNIYKNFTGSEFIADCHNAMIDGPWRKLPFAVSCLKKSKAVLVHNADISTMAKKFNIDTTVSKDPLPYVEEKLDVSNVLDKFQLVSKKYILAPWNFASDEPLEELMQAAKLTPDIIYVATWFTERLSEDIKSIAPENVVFTGYLEKIDFNYLIAHAGAIIALTYREGTQPSSASEAIAFKVPLIISSIKTAKLLYGPNVIYVDNNPESISDGAQEAILNNSKWRSEISSLKEKFDDELSLELELLRELISS